MQERPLHSVTGDRPVIAFTDPPPVEPTEHSPFVYPVNTSHVSALSSRSTCFPTLLYRRSLAQPWAAVCTQQGNSQKHSTSSAPGEQHGGTDGQHPSHPAAAPQNGHVPLPKPYNTASSQARC